MSMPNRYQYRLVDLFPLIMTWPPCLTGTYSVLYESYGTPMFIIIFCELLMTSNLIVGWLLGVKIANTLEFQEGWKRMGVVLLGWSFAPSWYFIVVWGLQLWKRLEGSRPAMLTKLEGGVETWILVPVVAVALASVWYTRKLNERADRVWLVKMSAQQVRDFHKG